MHGVTERLAGGDLHVEQHASAAVDELQELGERRHALASVFGAEPAAGVERLYLGERHVGDGAGAVGSAIDRAVVEDDGVAVGGEVEIDLNEIDAGFEAFGDRGEGILGGEEAGAAVAHDLGAAEEGWRGRRRWRREVGDRRAGAGGAGG